MEPRTATYVYRRSRTRADGSVVWYDCKSTHVLKGRTKTKAALIDAIKGMSEAELVEVLAHAREVEARRPAAG